MPQDTGAKPATSRLERRKLRTRAALIAAAQDIFAERGVADASIQEVTDAADVGFGTFYNHFASKAELFDAAVEEVLEQNAKALGALFEGEDDPAVVFTSSLRIVGRMISTHPRAGRVMMHSMGSLLVSPKGHVPHAMNDIRRAVEAGRFAVDDETATLAAVSGGLVAVMLLAAHSKDLDEGALVDAFARNMLRMLGVDEDEVIRLSSLPLPDFPERLPIL